MGQLQAPIIVVLIDAAQTSFCSSKKKKIWGRTERKLQISGTLASPVCVMCRKPHFWDTRTVHVSRVNAAAISVTFWTGRGAVALPASVTVAKEPGELWIEPNAQELGTLSWLPSADRSHKPWSCDAFPLRRNSRIAENIPQLRLSEYLVCKRIKVYAICRTTLEAEEVAYAQVSRIDWKNSMFTKNG